MKSILIVCASILVTGCSVFGQSDVQTAPYTLLTADESLLIEVRNYDSMILVSTSMSGDGENNAFRKLFNYIGGDNAGSTEIAMTAPVIMDEKNNSTEGTEIAMTAPVFMDGKAGEATMSFVMPKNFTLATTPKPNDPAVKVKEIKDYKVAAIQFSGTLSASNVQKHTEILSNWIRENGYNAQGEAVEASYNGPMTLPMWRRNELLIEIQ